MAEPSKELREVIERVFITMPLSKLDDRYREIVKAHRLNLEIGIDHHALDTWDTVSFRETGDWLKSLGIRMTVHAPYNEMFLGSPDRLVREAAQKRLDAAFEVIPFFYPVSVVVHLNFEVRRFGFIYGDWLARVVPQLKTYAKLCDGMGAIMALENVYEENPDAMIEVLEALKGYPVCHCLDVGHLHAFCPAGMKSWMERTGGYVRQLHLHDNTGEADSHAPIGRGDIDFSLVTELMARMTTPPVITLEPHREEHIWETLEGFRRKGLLEAMKKFG